MNNKENIMTTEAYTAQQISELLDMLAQYKELERLIEKKREDTSSPVQKISLTKPSGKMQNLDPVAPLEKQKRELGERMKFQNPLIWLGYKKEAYRGTQAALTTLDDLISHCKVDGICHKRFDAINKQLRKTHGGKDLNSGDYFPREMTLDDLFCDARFVSLCNSKDFMDLWSNNENYKGGKWVPYIPTKPDHDCSVSCSC